MNRRFFEFVFVGCLLASAACDKTKSPQGGPDISKPQEGRFQLRVSLYPWVPEPDSFVKWIETDFESKHPDIDLVIRPLVKSHDWVADQYIGDLAYEVDKTYTALTQEDNPDFQHLVELDTVILGTLAERDALSAFDIAGAKFLPAASEAVRWKGKTLGVPHWTCGYFVISEDATVRRTRNVDELLSTLKNASTERVDLAGNIDGSWDSILIYLDAFRDTYPKRDMQEALAQSNLDPAVANYFRAIGSACSKDGANHCGEDASDFFATGKADALIGYSERLHPVLANVEKTVRDLHIAAATLGDGDEPTLFTDALVMSQHCSSEQCRSAASKFASYYVSDEVFEVSLMSLDGKSSVPRYLLPSTKSAFDYGRVAKDRLYSQLKAEIEGARSYPNHGVPKAREEGAIQEALKEALGL